MIERVTNLLKDWRLDYLSVTPEFHSIRHKLLCMVDRLSTGEELRDGQSAYIQKAEEHIKLIEPRWEKMAIEGEEREVFVITRPSSE